MDALETLKPISLEALEGRAELLRRERDDDAETAAVRRAFGPEGRPS